MNDPRPTAPDRPSNLSQVEYRNDTLPAATIGYRHLPNADELLRAMRGRNLNDIAKQCGDLAREKGFRTEEPRPVSSTILLVITELAEAYEELRKGEDERTVYYGENGKPEGFPVEIADAIIRLLDMCDEWGLNIGKLVQEKLAYNATRGVRHGKRF